MEKEKEKEKEGMCAPTHSCRTVPSAPALLREKEEEEVKTNAYIATYVPWSTPVVD